MMNPRGGHLSNTVTWTLADTSDAAGMNFQQRISVKESFCTQAVVGPTFGLIVLGSVGKTAYH